MSIRSFGSLCLAALTVLIILGAGSLLIERWATYQRASRAFVAEDRIGLAFRAATTLAAERGPVNRALLVASPPPVLVEELRADAADSDRALAALEAALAGDGDPFAAQLPDLRARIDAARARVGEKLRRRPVEPALETNREVLAIYRAVLEQIDRFLAARIDATIALSPETGVLLDHARDAWSLRLLAGENGVLLARIVALGRPMNPAERDRLNATVGAIDQLWRDLTLFAAGANCPPHTRAGLARARDGYFGQHRPLREQVIAAGLAATPYPVDLETWRRDSFAANASLVGAMEAAIEDSRRIAEADRAHGFRGMALALGAIGGAVALALATMALFVARVIGPLLRLSEVMTRMSGGERGIEIPYRDRPDEMGGISRALAVFQDSLGRLAQLTAQREMWLLDLANSDHLTGCLNRRGFLSAAGAALYRARQQGLPVAMLVLDIDHFKRINDQYGHAAGDAVLREVVRRCRAVLRQGDLFGRLGGEEFVLLLTDAAEAGALRVAEAIRREVAAAPVCLAGERPVGVTISVGLLVCRDGGGGLEELIASADAALFRAKDAGRNRVFTASAPLAG